MQTVSDGVDGNIWMIMWSGLLTLILGHQYVEMRRLQDALKAASLEREDHCIPRTECVRTHEALEKRFESLETEVKIGITGVHTRLDKLYECREKD